MTPSDLQKWLADTGHTKLDLHRLTGVARSTIDRYLAGKHPIPVVFELALKALE